MDTLGCFGEGSWRFFHGLSDLRVGQICCVGIGFYGSFGAKHDVSIREFVYVLKPYQPGRF